jgi:hypothetical protein
LERRKRMEINLNRLREVAIDAISRFSEEYYGAKWLIDIEYYVLDMVKNNESELESCFTSYEITSMRQMLNHGYWVKWSESNSEASGSIVLFEVLDSIPIKNSAD